MCILVVCGLTVDAKGDIKYVMDPRGRLRLPGSKPLHSAIASGDRHFLDFVSRCFDFDPSSRLTPEDALRHPWISPNRTLTGTLGLTAGVPAGRAGGGLESLSSRRGSENGNSGNGSGNGAGQASREHSDEADPVLKMRRAPHEQSKSLAANTELKAPVV